MKMLRTVLGRRRIANEITGVVETWVEWVQRVTREVRGLMVDYGVPEWVEVHRDRVRTWSSRLQDMDKERWARKMFEWQPEGRRSRGRPCARWVDELYR